MVGGWVGIGDGTWVGIGEVRGRRRAARAATPPAFGSCNGSGDSAAGVQVEAGAVPGSFFCGPHPACVGRRVAYPRSCCRSAARVHWQPPPPSRRRGRSEHGAPPRAAACRSPPRPPPHTQWLASHPHPIPAPRQNGWWVGYTHRHDVDAERHASALRVYFCAVAPTASAAVAAMTRPAIVGEQLVFGDEVWVSLVQSTPG